MQEKMKKVFQILDECDANELYELLNFFEIVTALGQPYPVKNVKGSLSEMRDFLKRKFAVGTLHPVLLVNFRLCEINHAMCQTTYDGKREFLKEHGFSVDPEESDGDMHHRIWRYITDGKIDAMSVFPFGYSSRLMKPDVIEAWPLYMCGTCSKPTDKDGNSIIPDVFSEPEDYETHAVLVNGVCCPDVEEGHFQSKVVLSCQVM